MAEDWQAIAAEIKEAIVSVGFSVTLEIPAQRIGPASDPVYETATEIMIKAIDSNITKRDQSGTLVGQSVRVLTVDALTFVPTKNCRVNVRGTWHEIEQVIPLAPGGIDLLFDIELKS